MSITSSILQSPVLRLSVRDVSLEAAAEVTATIGDVTAERQHGYTKAFVDADVHPDGDPMPVWVQDDVLAAFRAARGERPYLLRGRVGLLEPEGSGWTPTREPSRDLWFCVDEPPYVSLGTTNVVSITAPAVHRGHGSVGLLREVFARSQVLGPTVEAVHVAGPTHDERLAPGTLVRFEGIMGADGRPRLNPRLLTVVLDPRSFSPAVRGDELAVAVNGVALANRFRVVGRYVPTDGIPEALQLEHTSASVFWGPTLVHAEHVNVPRDLGLAAPEDRHARTTVEGHLGDRRPCDLYVDRTPRPARQDEDHSRVEVSGFAHRLSPTSVALRYGLGEPLVFRHERTPDDLGIRDGDVVTARLERWPEHDLAATPSDWFLEGGGLTTVDLAALAAA